MGKYDDIDIENEKVKKIVHSALKEFAKYGASKASLNKILKGSDISKGVFYHYFKDKDQLFDFLIYYSYEYTFKTYKSEVMLEEDDIIKRINEMSKLKLKIISTHPYMLEFVDRFREEVMKNINLKHLADWRASFYTKNITYDKLRNPSMAKEVVYIVKSTYKGLFMELLDNLDDTSSIDVSEIIDKCDLYCKVLSNNFYK